MCSRVCKHADQAQAAGHTANEDAPESRRALMEQEAMKPGEFIPASLLDSWLPAQISNAAPACSGVAVGRLLLANRFPGPQLREPFLEPDHGRGFAAHPCVGQGTIGNRDGVLKAAHLGQRSGSDVEIAW